MPATLLSALLAPRLLLVGATALLRGTLTPATTALAWLALLAGTRSSGLALGRLTGLRSSWLLSPAATALLRRLALLWRLLGALSPTATTLARRLLLSPTALASLSPLLPA
ncbi:MULTISPECIES: hypothetical protein [unclassified Kribbella]|uniref:hypothetical protein n=1 Tax=unclassified Kribbella TaxID=2644121 RepID=UPI0030180F63